MQSEMKYGLFTWGNQAKRGSIEPEMVEQHNPLKKGERRGWGNYVAIRGVMKNDPLKIGRLIM